MAQERVQKILAQAGYGSRRECEKYIEAGRVTVNGKKIKLGDKADVRRDEIQFDKRPIKAPQALTYIALHKPRGVLSSTVSQGDLRTVLDLVPNSDGLHPVGRLDLDSEGLILLTNDGDLTNKLTHPRYGHTKEYRVLVARRPDRKQLDTWARGVILPDGYETKPVEIRKERTFGKGMWLRVIMSEGRKRQVRETAGVLGLPVAKLIRVRISSLELGSLKARQWRELTAEEISELKKKPGEQSKSGPQRQSKRRLQQRPRRRTSSRSDERSDSKPRSGPRSRPGGRAGSRTKYRSDSRSGGRSKSGSDSRSDSRSKDKRSRK